VSVLTRKLLRDLRATRGQVIAVVSIITVGVMCYVGMLQTYENLDLAKHSYYTQCRMADFWVSLKKTPASEIAALSDLPGVAEVRSRISFPITFDLPDVARPLTGRVISMPDRRRSVINDFVLKRGGYFTESRRNEVILSDEFA